MMMLQPVNCWFCTFDPMPLAMMLAQFMGIVFGMAWFPCCVCTKVEECDGCDDGTPPQVQIDISGASGALSCNDGTAGTCDVLNGTFILDFVGASSIGCWWYLEDAIASCNTAALGGASLICGPDGDEMPCGSMCFVAPTGAFGTDISFRVRFGGANFGAGIVCERVFYSNTHDSTCMEWSNTALGTSSKTPPAQACGGFFFASDVAIAVTSLP